MKISIIHNDNEMCERLKHFLCLNNSNIEIAVFNDFVFLNDYLSKNECDLVLCDYRVDFDVLFDPSKVIYLCDNKIETYNNRPVIYYFQSVEKLMKDINDKFKVSKLDKSLDKANKVIGFIGINGNVGNSSLAISTTRYLARSNKVAYLSFSPFQKQYFKNESNNTLSEAIMAIKSNIGNVALRVLSYLETVDNVSFFNLCKDPYDYVNTESKDIATLIQIIVDSKKFDYVIIDNTLQFDDKTKKVIEVSDVLIYVDRMNNFDKAINIMKLWVGEEILSKKKPVSIINNPGNEYAKNCDFVIGNLQGSYEDVILHMENNYCKEIGDRL